MIWAQSSETYTYQLKGRIIPSDGPSSTLLEFRIDDNRLVEPPAYNHYYSLAYAYTQDEYLVVWAYDEGVGFPAQVIGRQVEGEGSFVVMAHGTNNCQFPDVT